MQNVTMLLVPICVPPIVRLITPDGAAGSGQSLFAPDDRLPYVSVTPVVDATSPTSGAPPGPQSSLQPEARRPLILERKSKRCMCHHRVAEPVVLDDVLEDAFESRGCPAAFE